MALWPSLLSRTFSVLVFGFVVLNCFVVDKFGSHAQGVTPLLPVDEDFVPPSENSSSTGTSAGTVVGIVAAIGVVIFLILGILWWNGCSGPKNSTGTSAGTVVGNGPDLKGIELSTRSFTLSEIKAATTGTSAGTVVGIGPDLKGIELRTRSFTLSEIKAATNNFDSSKKIGQGGSGLVYKGLLPDGTVIAVKRLSRISHQGAREFVNEIGLIALQHPHLVRLHGCCNEGDQLLLVYEYVENNSLARALFGPEEYQLNLDWATRHKICVGIAKGLAYLHEESGLKFVHRDIKPTNVLLDRNLDPKISDFGLARLYEEDKTHVSTRVAGTFGYMAPEYATTGHLTQKADVYSFGIVALVIVSGKRSSHRTKEDSVSLLGSALVLKKEGTLLELVDRKLGQDYNREEAITMIKVALLCSNASATDRPAMSSVVSMLEGKTAVQDFDIPDASMSTDERNRRHFQVINEQETSETRTLSMDGQRTAASTTT